ncbi:CHASE3 domain-containing protein [Pseudobacteriovorax antillogorgiicola]|nr:CHASE3 domain-containing protein [Pseudobacteriovorax antillogorgiicola]
MKTMTRRRIFGAASLAMALVTLIATIIFFNSRSLTEAHGWVVHTNKVIGQMNALLLKMIDMETGQRGYLMSGDKNFLEPYLEAKDKFEPFITELKNTVSDNPVQVARLSTLHDLKRSWLNDAAQKEMALRAAYDAGEINKEEFESTLKQAQGKKTMDEFRRVLAEAIAMEVQLNEERTERSESLAAISQILLVFGSFGSILIGSIFLWRVTNSVSTDISHVSEFLVGASRDLKKSSRSLAGYSRAITQAAQDQASSLQETSASITQMSQTINSTSDKATDAAKQVAFTNEIAAKGKHTIDELVNSISEIQVSNDQVTSQIHENNEKISNIVQVITEIDQKTKVINDIVFQTKLLSFNASVEAARAGDQGKGFAVVAEEVGNLAAMSGEASKMIQDLLETSKVQVHQIVEETMTKTVALLDKSRDRVASGVETANRCGENFDQIAENIQLINQLSNDISEANREQSEGVGQIRDAIGNLDQVTHGNAKTARSASDLSLALTQQSDSMSESIERLAKIVGSALDHEEQKSSVALKENATPENRKSSANKDNRKRVA